MTDAISLKKTYREQARLHRERLPVAQSDYEQVIDVFFNFFTPKKSAVIAAYWPINKEFDCRYLMDELHQRGFQCALPIVEKGSKVMKFGQWVPETELNKNGFGIMEPSQDNLLEPDYILAPLLAFDQKGNRLGQGRWILRCHHRQFRKPEQHHNLYWYWSCRTGSLI